MVEQFAFTVDVKSVANKQIPCHPEQKMLDAFLRRGEWIPNSCNQGTCGTCKVKVLSGTVAHPPTPDSVLSYQEQEEGFVLTCQSVPTSDVVIAVPAADKPSSTGHLLRDMTATVLQMQTTATDTLTISVGIDEPLEFSAGQYVELAIPGTNEVRQYSMANPPSQSNVLEFHIRRQPGGLATDAWIFDSLMAGDAINLTGPWGDFVYDDDDDETGMILLAGGTGLAPLKSIALHALTVNPQREIHLYHGVRRSADLYDVEFWESLARNYSGVRYVPCVSREHWSGRTGYVGDAMLADFDSCRNYSGYLCGPPAMVDAGVKAFKRKRMSARRIRREKYTPAPALINA